jgi:hypothetical protein
MHIRPACQLPASCMHGVQRLAYASAVFGQIGTRRLCGGDLLLLPSPLGGVFEGDVPPRTDRCFARTALASFQLEKHADAEPVRYAELSDRVPSGGVSACRGSALPSRRRANAVPFSCRSLLDAPSPWTSIKVHGGRYRFPRDVRRRGVMNKFLGGNNTPSSGSFCAWPRRLLAPHGGVAPVCALAR